MEIMLPFHEPVFTPSPFKPNFPVDSDAVNAAPKSAAVGGCEGQRSKRRDASGQETKGHVLFKLCLAGAASAAVHQRGRLSQRVRLQALPTGKTASKKKPGLLKRVLNRAKWMFGGREQEWERQIIAAKESVAVAEGRADSWRRRLDDESLRRKGVEEQLAAARKRLDEAQKDVKQIPKLTTKIGELQGELRSALDAAATVKDELDEKESAFKAALKKETGKVEELEKRIVTLQGEYTKISDEFELQQNESSARIASLEMRLQVAEKKLEESRRNESDLVKQLQTAEGRIRELLDERVKWAQEEIPKMFGLGEEEAKKVEEKEDAEESSASKPEALFKTARKASDELEAAMREVEEAAAKVTEVAASTGAAESSEAHREETLPPPQPKPKEKAKSGNSALRSFLMSRLE